MLLPSLGTSIANVALPSLAEAFDAPFQAVQWVVLAYLLATTALVVAAGRLGDLVGRKRLLLAGIALFVAASWLGGAATSLAWLVAARVLQGVGAAAMMALTLAMVGAAVPKEKSGSAMGLLGTMSAVGTALGPTLGGLLIGACGWPGIFRINLPLGLVALALAAWALPADRPAPAERRARFDHAGTLVLALTLAAYALAMTLGRGQFGAGNLGLLALAALGVALFVRIERRAAAPLIRLAALREPALGRSLVAGLLVAAVMMATLVVGPFYLAGALGLAPVWVGLAMSAGPVVAALAGVPAGRLVDRFGAARMGAAGLVGMLIGSAGLAAAPLAWGVAGYVLPLVVLTAHYALFQAANNTGVMAGVPQDRRGVVSGLVNLARNLGLI
ncbi:MAG: MFS transporter, partial [Burkholderiales bacterium]|nr:MFS transporter [Burkholderiales bacterium]